MQQFLSRTALASSDVLVQAREFYLSKVTAPVRWAILEAILPFQVNSRSIQQPLGFLSLAACTRTCIWCASLLHHLFYSACSFGINCSHDIECFVKILSIMQCSS